MYGDMYRETCTYIVIYRERDLHISVIYRERPLRGLSEVSLYTVIYIETCNGGYIYEDSIYITIYTYILLYRERPLSSLYLLLYRETCSGGGGTGYSQYTNIQEYIQSPAHRGI